MKYRNAAEILPSDVLREVQRHAAGQLLYIPVKERRAWGEGTGAREEYYLRNAQIRREWRMREIDVPQLSEIYCLAEETIHKIIYRKETKAMSDYYWQTDLIRMRRSRPDDWKLNWKGSVDSQQDFFADGEQKLPVDESNWPEIWSRYVNANENSAERILLAVETLDGTYVGGGNIHGIDSRNGTFGIFIETEDMRYTIEAARLMLDYAFNECRLHKCNNGICFEEDVANIELFEALGFTKEGVRRQEVFHQGRWWDEYLYGLLAEEFNAGK